MDVRQAFDPALSDNSARVLPPLSPSPARLSLSLPACLARSDVAVVEFGNPAAHSYDSTCICQLEGRGGPGAAPASAH